MIYSAPVYTTCLVIVSKIWLVFADILYQALTSKKLIIFFQIKVAYQTYISNYGIIRTAAKKTVVVIYKVMYTEHCENTSRIEAIECINNESLD